MTCHHYLTVGTAALMLAVSPCLPSQAADVNALRGQVNSGVVGVMCARVDSAFTRLCEDLSLLLDKRHDLRVLGIMGKGSLTNIEDLMFLRGVDVAFAQADVMEFYEQTGTYPDIKQRLRYITTINQEEMHILARSGIQTIWDLEGKTVNFGKPDTGTFMTASVIFDDLGINVNATTLSHEEAKAELRAGRIDAIAKIDGIPVGLFQDLQPSEGFHFLEVPEETVSEVYGASVLTANDYPNLVIGGPVPTISVSSIMAVYNWPDDHPRGKNVDRLVQAFFDRFGELQDPDSSYDPEWREVDLSADLPGWERYRPAQRLLASR